VIAEVAPAVAGWKAGRESFRRPQVELNRPRDSDQVM